MKRILTTFCVLLVVGLVGSGCNVSSTPPVAGRVDGSAITTARLDGLMEALKGDGALLCLSGEGTHPVTTGAGTDTWSETYAGYVLAQLIKFQVLANLVTGHHLYLPASDVSVARAQIASSLAAASRSGCSATGVKALAEAGDAYRTDLVANQLQEDAYLAYLAGTSLHPNALASWEQAHPASTLESCTSVIQVTSHSQAVSIEAAIRAGASFASEANSNNPSGATGAGGSVGCIVEQDFPGTLGLTVAALPVGVVSPPVTYQADSLLFLVTKRLPEPLPAVLGLLGSDETTSFNAHYAAALSKAHITVSPAYGSWSVAVSKGGVDVIIQPPSDSSCAYALAATAAGCATTLPTLPAASAGG